MKHLFYDIEKNGLVDPIAKSPLNTRFIEPPIITYFVTTIDTYGNINVTPVSLGTHMGFNPSKEGGRVGYFSFSLVHVEKTDNDEEIDRIAAVRDTENNLEDNGECV